MKEVSSKIITKDKEYKLVFNLNAMQEIQEEYQTLDNWGKLTDGKGGEPNIKALIFGMRAMLNEGIEIENEENGEKTPLLSLKQVGRILTEVGLETATATVNDTVVNSVKDDSGKNA